MHSHAFWYFAVQDIDALLQSFEQAHSRIVSREHARCAGELDEQWQQFRQVAIHPLRERLHNEHVLIAVDDERRQQVGFAMHKTVRRRVELERAAKAYCRRETRAPERLVDFLFAARQYSQADLRLIAVKRATEVTLSWAKHFDDGAGVGSDVGDVTLIDPRVSTPDAVFAAARYDCSRNHDCETEGITRFSMRVRRAVLMRSAAAAGRLQ
jgi:hypothetical protein